MPNKFVNGFTLVEIMVAVSLMALVGAVAMPNIRNLSRSQELDAAASQLSNTLKKAQSSASSRIKCKSNEAASSWQVNLNTVPTSKTFELICQASPAQTVFFTSPFAATPTSVTTFAPSTVPCAGQNMSIIYTGSQMSYICGTDSPVTGTAVTITLTGTGTTKKVIAEPGGIVRVE